jgi:hypothetical protein
MSRRPWPRLSALACLACLAAVAPAQPPEVAPAPTDTEPPARARVSATGFDALRGLSKRAGLQPLGSWEDLFSDPSRNVLIVLGDTRLLNARLGEIREFLNAGGVVLIATDRPSVDLLGVSVSGERVRDAESTHRYQISDCPIVFAEDESRPIFGGLWKVATNLPSYLRGSPARGIAVTVLAWFYESAQVFPPGMARQPTYLPFAAMLSVGRGRLLMMADHSVFINSMMMRTDNDNFVLAERTLEWLATDGAARRTGCLFLEEGRVRTSFDVLWIDPPPPSLKEIAEILKDNWPLAIPIMNAVARAAQEPDGPLRDLQGPDSPIRRWARSLIPRSVLGQGLAVAATVALILLALGRMTTSRQRVDTEVTPAAGPPGPEGLAGAPLRQRLVAQAERGDWYDVAREQVRERFLALGLLEPGPDRPPAVGVPGGGWLRRRKLRRQVLELWRIGFGREPVTVPAAKWRELAARLDALERSAVAGVWRFEPTREGA